MSIEEKRIKIVIDFVDWLQKKGVTLGRESIVWLEKNEGKESGLCTVAFLGLSNQELKSLLTLYNTDKHNE